ncbi:MAG TPA: Smr/MutS family protein [Flavobacteriales bacterium]|nr:DNA mismatch repair protein MutS [Flavobacteriales bacterium]HRE75954.1 Smr/MutS family protein [Flavobacteriales bacterium]HRE98233.1 Smr/MutS family protein [Flavobacteriales bacterium]HRJ36477.1 Smr/MutS family protein [Flavobacteriales bacterium]HRJ39082.1 Smr/MutS family protein [Flavobacteriales bacterium]
MALQIGDRVTFLNEAGNGIVRALTVKGKALVETADGLEIEYPLKYLVKMPDETDYSLPHANEQAFIRGKLRSENKAKKKTTVREKILEIDLHIYELTDNHRGLSNADMLRMQLQAFKRKMEEAQRKRVQKLIVIHGVGEGVLRSEIRTALRQYENIEVLDADYAKYGRGATEVRFFGV